MWHLSLWSFYLRCIFKEFHIEAQQNKETLGPLISVFKKRFLFPSKSHSIHDKSHLLEKSNLGAKGLQGELETRNAVCVHLRFYLFVPFSSFNATFSSESCCQSPSELKKANHLFAVGDAPSVGFCGKGSNRLLSTLCPAAGFRGI